MNNQSESALAKLFDDGAEVDRRVRNAIRAAIADHQRTGDPIAIWRDGQVVLLPPDQIKLPEPTPTQKAETDAEEG